MRIIGFKPIGVREWPVWLRAQAQPIEEAHARILPHFTPYLERLSRQRFVLDPSTQAVTEALTECVPSLRDLLGEKYLGLALGGSLVKGLGTIVTSDVDFFIFTDGVHPEEKEGLKLVRGALKQGGLRPCLRAASYNFSGLNSEPQVEVLAGFADYFFDPGTKEGRIKELALEYFQRLAGSAATSGQRRQLLEADLKEVYDLLSGSDERYVVSRYLKNVLKNSEAGGQVPGNVLLHPAFFDLLMETARPYLEQRRAAFPFPEELLV